MQRHYLSAQTRTQNAFRFGTDALKARAKEERGEIGSTLILMAILVGAALLASTFLRDSIAGLVTKITGSIDSQDAGGGGGGGE